MSLAPPPRTRFLIIDDVASMRILIRGLLFKLEYKNVVEAEAVPEAIALLEKMHSMGTPVDIVLSDWEMPNYTGLEMLKEVRSNDKFTKLPFIMVTGVRSTDNVMAALQAGVSGYLVKPFSEAQLLAQVALAWKKASGG
jgi:two-component system chemotaxis response regulator CheY